MLSNYIFVYKLISFKYLKIVSPVTFVNKSYKEELEDTKGVIRIRISKNRQHNGQQKKYKRTNNINNILVMSDEQ